MKKRVIVLSLALLTPFSSTLADDMVANNDDFAIAFGEVIALHDQQARAISDNMAANGLNSDDVYVTMAGTTSVYIENLSADYLDKLAAEAALLNASIAAAIVSAAANANAVDTGINFGDRLSWFSPNTLSVRVSSSRENQGPVSTSFGYKGNISSLQVMLYGSYDDKTFLNFGLSNNRSSVVSKSSFNNSLKTNNITFKANIVRSEGNGVLSAAIDLGYTKYKTTRNIIIGALNYVASSNVGGLNSRLSGSYLYNLKEIYSWKVIPVVHGGYSWNRRHSYSENGAGIVNLVFPSNTQRALEVGAGLILRTLMDHENNIIKPYLRYSYNRRISGSESITRAALSGVPNSSFNIIGAPVSKNRHNIGFGFDVRTASNIMFSLGYDLDKKKKYTSNTVYFSANWRV